MKESEREQAILRRKKKRVVFANISISVGLVVILLQDNHCRANHEWRGGGRVKYTSLDN